MCVLVALALVHSASRAAHAQDAGKVLIEWRFDKEGDKRGWNPTGNLAEAAVRGGALRGRANGSDPIIFSPVFEIPATATSCVEISMKATKRAPSELYWTQTLEGKFGGFSSEKHRLFQSRDDGQFHVYRIYPFWQSAKKIIRLRIDPPNDGEFEIQWVRIIDRGAAAASSAISWNKDGLAKQWKPLGDVAEEEGGTILASPPLALTADDYAFLCLRASSDAPGATKVYVVSQSQIGWETLNVPLHGGGKMRTYNIDLGALKKWHGKIIMLGLQMPKEGAKLESVQVSRDPGGPAEIELTYFGPVDALNRAGRNAGLTCNLKNLGGQVAENVVATLQAPAGVKILDGAAKKLDRLSLYLPQNLQWQVQVDSPGTYKFELKVQSAGAATVTSTTMLEITPPPQVAKAHYVPEPQPVKSKYEVGTFYFPGWHTAARWQPIRDYPNRKPVLGWYDEANPQCADWQIKWAVEHGITFFMVDWYWDRGHTHLEHWVHNAYAKARYKKYLPWAIMWANHNQPGSHSAEDWKKVTQYWIDNYLKAPEYYRIDGRPVIFIWAPQNIRRDVGGSAEAAKLYAMSQEMAKAAGLHKGLYFVAMSSHQTEGAYKELKTEGYEASTSYHGFELARKQAGSDRFPFSLVADTCVDVWKKEDQNSQGLTYMPVVDTGWDARPWHGEKTIVVSGRTPQLLGQMCREARKYADATGKKIIALGPWNEWGEGSYIEPYTEYGFGDLDAIREAFCDKGNWPPNLTPSDVGLGGYDLPPDQPKTAWEFNTDNDLEGWTSNGQVADLKVSGGLLSGKTTGRDPVLSAASVRVEADRFHRIAFRMRADVKTQVEIYWGTPLLKISAQSSMRADIPGDGQFHDYEVDLSKNPRWRGIINQLRFDPATGPGVDLAIDYIRLIP